MASYSSVAAEEFLAAWRGELETSLVPNALNEMERGTVARDAGIDFKTTKTILLAIGAAFQNAFPGKLILELRCGCPGKTPTIGISGEAYGVARPAGKKSNNLLNMTRDLIEAAKPRQGTSFPKSAVRHVVRTEKLTLDDDSAHDRLSRADAETRLLSLISATGKRALLSQAENFIERIRE
jgi:hypothetical protein